LNEDSCCVMAVACVSCVQSNASVWSVLLAALFLFALYLWVALRRVWFPVGWKIKRFWSWWFAAGVDGWRWVLSGSSPDGSPIRLLNSLCACMLLHICHWIAARGHPVWSWSQLPVCLPLLPAVETPGCWTLQQRPLQTHLGATALWAAPQSNHQYPPEWVVPGVISCCPLPQRSVSPSPCLPGQNHPLLAPSYTLPRWLWSTRLAQPSPAASKGPMAPLSSPLYSIVWAWMALPPLPDPFWMAPLIAPLKGMTTPESSFPLYTGLATCPTTAPLHLFGRLPILLAMGLGMYLFLVLRTALWTL